MNLQTINLDGIEFVLLPADCYKAKKKQIDEFVAEVEDIDEDGEEYVPFVLEDYFKNPVALERIKRGVSQKQLAELLDCSQSYVSQLERREKVSDSAIAKVKKVLKNYPDRWANMGK